MDNEKLDLIEKNLDNEFKKRGKKIRIYHIKDVHPFRAVTVALIVYPDLRVPSWLDVSNGIHHNIEYQKEQCGHVSAAKLIRYICPNGCGICDMRDQFNRKLGRVMAKRRVWKIMKLTKSDVNNFV